MENHQKAYNDFPADKCGVGENIGKIHVSYDKFTVDNATHGEFEVGDLLYGPKIPSQARILDVIVTSEILGTTGIFSAGWLTNGTEATDTDGFIDAIDAGGQAVTEKMTSGLAGAAGQFIKLSAETQFVLACTEASTSADGKVIEVAVVYAMA